MESRNIAEGLEQRDVEILVKIMLQLKYFRAVYKSSQAVHINKIFAMIKAKKIDELRAHLRAILNLPAINNSEIAELRLYAKVIHTLLLLIAKYAPKNDKNAQGQVVCYFSYEPMPSQFRLLLGSTGYQININFGAAEGERVAVYSYLRENRDADGKFRYPVDNNRAEIEYLEARAQAIRTGLQEPEIPNVPDAEIIPRGDCFQRGATGSVVFGILGALAGVGMFIYAGVLLSVSEFNFPFDNASDSFASILKIIGNLLCVLIVGGISGTVTGFFGACFHSLLDDWVISPIEDCYLRHANSRLPQESMEFLTSLITPVVAMDVKSEAEEKDENNDLNASLLNDDNFSRAEEGIRNQRLRQQLHLLPPPQNLRVEAAGIELERKAAP